MIEQESFDPRKHLMQLKSKEGPKDYLPVQFRLVWFREQCPEGTIDTEEMEVDTEREVEVEAFVWNNEKRKSEKVMKRAKGYARFKAVVTDGKGARATGTGSECAADFNDYAEKAETKAIGRALAALGYGTQFAPDLDEAHRIVDAPVERSQGNSDAQQNTTSNHTNNRTTATNTASQSNANAQQSATNLSDIPTVQKLRERAKSLNIEWDTVLVEAFEKPIAEGKVTLQALQAKGDELPPGYCQRIASYLQAKQAA